MAAASTSGILLLAACGAPSKEPLIVAGTERRAFVEVRPVSPERALALFEAVCASSLPNFSAASAAVVADGNTRPSPVDPKVGHGAVEDVSFEVSKAGGTDATCSMVFGTTSDADAVFSGFGKRYPASSAIGTLVTTVDASQSFSISIELHEITTLPNGTTYVEIKMTSLGS